MPGVMKGPYHTQWVKRVPSRTRRVIPTKGQRDTKNGSREQWEYPKLPALWAENSTALLPGGITVTCSCLHIGNPEVSQRAQQPWESSGSQTSEVSPPTHPTMCSTHGLAETTARGNKSERHHGPVSPRTRIWERNSLDLLSVPHKRPSSAQTVLKAPGGSHQRFKSSYRCFLHGWLGQDTGALPVSVSLFLLYPTSQVTEKTLRDSGTCQAHMFMGPGVYNCRGSADGATFN